MYLNLRLESNSRVIISSQNERAGVLPLEEFSDEIIEVLTRNREVFVELEMVSESKVPMGV